MITFITLIYIGGFAFLYSKLFHLACCSENSIEIEDDEALVPLLSVDSASSSSSSSSSSDSDDGLLNEPVRSRLSQWRKETKIIPTFRKKNLPHLSPDQTLLLANPDRKSVRFNPVSFEHETFSPADYIRRNQEYFDAIARIRNDPDFANTVYLELKDYMTYEMDVHNQVELDIADESKEYENSEEQEDIFKFEYDDIIIDKMEMI